MRPLTSSCLVLLSLFIFSLVHSSDSQSTTPNWSSLKSTLSPAALLTLPSTPSYTLQVSLIKILPVSFKPAQQLLAIVSPTSSADVSATVKFAAHNNLQITVKAGSHGFDGRKIPNRSGIMLDFSTFMTNVNVSPSDRLVTFEAGVLTTNITGALQKYGLGHAQGNCANIGASGFHSYGGFGLWSRKTGLGLDNIVEYEVVKANGEIVKANQRTNQDFYWGLRGALPALGIVTKFTIKTFDVGAKGAGFFGGVFIVQASKEFTREYHRRILNNKDLRNDNNFISRITNVNIFVAPNSTFPTFTMELALWGPGSAEEKMRRVKPLVDLIDLQAREGKVRQRLFPTSYYNYTGTLINDVPAGGKSYIGSGILTNDENVINTLDIMYDRTIRLPFSLWELSLAGGQLASLPRPATPFHARDMQWLWAVYTGVRTDQEFFAVKTQFDAVRESVRGLSKTRNFYPNYVNIDQSSEFDAYQVNLPRLERLKRKVDPTNLFDNSFNLARKCLPLTSVAVKRLTNGLLAVRLSINATIEFDPSTSDSLVSIALHANNAKCTPLKQEKFEVWNNGGWRKLRTLWVHASGAVVRKDKVKSLVMARIRVPNLKRSLTSAVVRIELGRGQCLQTVIRRENVYQRRRRRGRSLRQPLSWDWESFSGKSVRSPCLG